MKRKWTIGRGHVEKMMSYRRSRFIDSNNNLERFLL